MIRRSLPAVVVMGLLLASVSACGGDDSDVGPTSTAAPSSVAPADQTADLAAVFPESEPVDFMLLADSGGGGVAELYAPLAAEALDREVRVRDHTLGGWTADQFRSAVGLAWADEVADTEIFVFYVHPGGYEPEGFLPCLDAVDWDSPVAPSTLPEGWEPPEATTVEDWQAYREVLDQVYDEIWSLRDGQPTIIRAYGVYLPWVGQWRELGIEDACVAGEEAADQARRESAEAHGAVFVSMMDVFAGPEHDEDPVEKGVVSEDGMHLNEAGHVMLVEALAAAGFELSEQPG